MLGGYVERASPAATAGCPLDWPSAAPILAPELAEWTELDSIDGEAPSPSRRRAQPRKWRGGCCRNSSSSGYSSRSGASAPAKLAPASLAVIREGETIPRPIWPAVPSSGRSQAGRRPASIYGGLEACRCGSGSIGSIGSDGSCDCGRSGSLMADRELLRELSRTLSAVLEGDSAKADRQILRDISRSVARRAPIYEEIRAYAGESTVGLANPINSSLYQQRCHCARESFLYQSQPSSSSSSSAQQIAAKPDDRKRQSTPTVFWLPEHRNKSSAQGNENRCVSCNCMNYLGGCDATPEKLGSKQSLQKSQCNQSDLRADNDVRLNYPSMTPHDYTTLECSDSSSSEAGAVSKEGTWSSDFRGFDKNLDFTLDGFKAERLGRVIAKAKRRRQWCRVFVVIFGLVFFILSVVIVSLSVTKGRKVFGSM